MTSSCGRCYHGKHQFWEQAPCVYKTASALAVSFAICKAATYVNKLVGIQGGDLLASTAIVVILATLLPKEFGYLAPADDTVALVLMQVFEMSPHQLIYILLI